MTSSTNPRDHLISSLAKLKQCGRCKGWIYVAHIHGWEKKVEPTPLNIEEEIAYRLTGVKIYQTMPIGSQFELMERTAWQITHADPRSKALAEHDCSTPTLFEPAPIYSKPTLKETEF